ncbi:MAG: methyltransferase domain-containing protein [Congregibacter sp.]
MSHRGGDKNSPALMKALNVIGSDVNNFECPWCGCNDRDRHLLLYIEALGLASRFSDANVLHVAPEKTLRSFVLDQQPNMYLAIDLARKPFVSAQMNVENLALAPQSVNIVIANHVLEHIDNLKSALSEFFRVLKPGGLAILQTPYSSILRSTFCDPGITADAARLEAYGQEDHVRLFGADVFDLVEHAGFTSKVVEHKQVLAHIDPKRSGINPREPLFLFEKPNSS